MSAMASPAPGSGTSRSASGSGEPPMTDEMAIHRSPEEAAAEALALAETILERALRVGATEAEVLVTSDDSALTRFANSEIHQNVAESSRTVNLRFVAGK